MSNTNKTVTETETTNSSAVAESTRLGVSPETPSPANNFVAKFAGSPLNDVGVQNGA